MHRLTFYYKAVEGPIRNGAAKHKPELHSSLSDDELSYTDFIAWAEDVTDWGQNQYANDHGTQSDHEMLLHFINAAVRLWDQVDH